VIDAWLSGLAQKTEPAEAAVAQLETEVEQLASQEATLRTRLREAESSYSEAQLARSREEDRRQRLRGQIMDDFGLVDMEPMQDQPDQPPLPLAELVSTLPVVEALPTGLDEEVHQLRGQIKRLGPTNPGALAEYAEVRDRHSFLSAQAADLEEASHRLREIIAELDEVMRREFGRTFEMVEARFRENFTRLFGGGMARLSLTEPEDLGATGVEITARPPGKRQQTLALLSGGERSLTAVALIFAFLQTNPPPFCILDEVDAMLDEANVQRFRAMLQELAQTTQFIVITHNRTTIQAADTIYGVSMGEDSASQVVSLRLEGDRVATATGTTVELRAG
jgi:chromosome segregation protein